MDAGIDTRRGVKFNMVLNILEKNERRSAGSKGLLRILRETEFYKKRSFIKNELMTKSHLM